MEFDLKQLETFRRIVEHQSFSRAAVAMHLSQSAVSERMAVLERAVGVPLLDRLGKAVVPTAAGRLLLDRAQRLLGVRDEIAMELADYLGKRSGTMQIGASTIPSAYILPEILAEFRQAHPHVMVSVVVGDSEETSRRVAAGDLEAGIVGRKGTTAHLRYDRLWSDRLVLVVPPGHRWVRRRSVRPDQLAEEPFVMREAGSGTRRVMLDHLRGPGRSPLHLKPVVELGSTAAVKEAVRASVGVSIISERALAGESGRRAVKAISLEGFDLVRHFYLIVDRRRKPSPLCRALLTLLRSRGRDAEA